MSNITNAILSADETFLITLSNKGIYNRALKEYETSVSNIEVADNTVKAEFSDGTFTTITDSIQNHKCTCPSRTVCKHLVMAVIAVQNKLKQETDSAVEANIVRPDTSADIPDFDFVAEITPQQLEKLASKKIYTEALFNIKTGSKAEIEISSVLSVTAAHNQITQTVRFLPANNNLKTSTDLANWANTSVCTCKSSNFCAHKTSGVLHFILHKKGEAEFNQKFFPESSSEASIEFGAYVIPYIKQFAADIFSSGLARNSDAVSQRFLQLSTICHSQNLANMERSCDRIAGQYELFEKKSAIFSVNNLMSELCSLILQCDTLEKLNTSATGKNTANIVGVFREQYNQIPPADFYGLGAYQWHSMSGYTGVTAIFYSPELSDFAVYTTAMPDANKPDAIQMYNSPAPWGIATKLSEITDINFTLKNAKINSRNNISSSAETTAHINGKTNIFDAKLSKIRYDNFTSLVENLWEKYDGGENQNQNQPRSLTALIFPKKYDKANFNSITQIYSFAVYDKDGRKINISVKYEPATNLLIENLKKLENRKLLYGPILLRVYIENGKLKAFPIALYVDYINEEEFISNGKLELEVVNLSLDDLDKIDKKGKKDKNANKGSKYFNW
ncbi:MAG: hypothetical protein FWD71_00230 [Oscillospiraceae bacterium]|nr:hypothetical protein [Oscillospiraceae bacterium]